MKKSLFQKVICFILSVTTLFGVLALTVGAAASDPIVYDYESNRDSASSLDEMKALANIPTYEEYLTEWGKDANGNPTVNKDATEDIVVDLDRVIDVNDNGKVSNGTLTADSSAYQDAIKESPENWIGFDKVDKNGNVINSAESSYYLPAIGATTWEFDVKHSGYYYLELSYYSCITGESSISSIERKLLIDGVAPFKEATYLKLDKSWAYTNVGEPVVESVPAGTPNSVSTEYITKSDGYYKVVTVVENGKKTTTSYTIIQDDNGNSMAPTIEQSASWRTYFVQDSTGYYTGYLCFYLKEGKQQITLEAEREPLIVDSIIFHPYKGGAGSKGDGTKLPVGSEVTLDEVKDWYAQNNITSATAKDDSDGVTLIQAEFPDFVSDKSVNPANDKTSSATYPSVSNAQLYNVIGKTSFNALGQWAAYKFRVSDTGLYKLGMRFLQSALQGMYLCRGIKISGGAYGSEPVSPFAEAADVQFEYSKDWQSEFMGDSNGNIFEFYFEEGVEYTLYVECSLGSLATYIQEVENVLNEVNAAYLKILQLTGSSPDEYRNYQFLEIMPDVLICLGRSAERIENVRLALKELCGTNGSHIATLGTIATLLDEMSRNDGYNIAGNMSNLKSNLGTLGTWINDSKKGLLLLDSISICPQNADDDVLPATKTNFFKTIWFEISAFVYSFFTDYDKMGVREADSSNTDISIDVWLAMGRDQSNIWRTMIDQDTGFTQKTGYAVNLKLVTGATLLPSILSGKGPDVYMGLGSATVINYAIRDAVLPVSGHYCGKAVDANGDGVCDTCKDAMPGKADTFQGQDIFSTTYYTYKDENGYTTTTEKRDGVEPSFVSCSYDQYIEDNFVPAATETLTLLEKSYGLPQTMAFSMMFYRMDVLAELNLQIPETWTDLLELLPVLQSNNMEIGVSYVLALDFMLYQKGGSMWYYADPESDDPQFKLNPEYAGSKIALDTDIAKESFEYVCRMFSDYSFPISYDSANRFRTGEMPSLIGSYEDLYNKLVVYATEIEGLWEFSPLPGCETTDKDGRIMSINYDSLATVTASVMLHGCEGEERFAAWQYMQWQTSESVQAEYGNRMVAILGPSAKYETANINAIDDLSWTADEKNAIMDQIKHMSSIVNYPGSYYISRYVKFAFLDAVNKGADPVEALSSYIDAINAEITRKREEFGLATGDPK